MSKKLKKRFSHKNARIGERVYVKKAPIGLKPLLNVTGEIISINKQEFGITVRFFLPVEIKYPGLSCPQTVHSFTLKSGFLNYLPETNETIRT